MKTQTRNSKQHANNFMKKFKKEESNIDAIADLDLQIEALRHNKEENLLTIRNCNNGNRVLNRKIIKLTALKLKIEIGK
jgi:hypothetical protein